MALSLPILALMVLLGVCDVRSKALHESGKQIARDMNLLRQTEGKFLKGRQDMMDEGLKELSEQDYLSNGGDAFWLKTDPPRSEKESEADDHWQEMLNKGQDLMKGLENKDEESKDDVQKKVQADSHWESMLNKGKNLMNDAEEENDVKQLESVKKEQKAKSEVAKSENNMLDQSTNNTNKTDTGDNNKDTEKKTDGEIFWQKALKKGLSLMDIILKKSYDNIDEQMKKAGKTLPPPPPPQPKVVAAPKPVRVKTPTTTTTTTTTTRAPSVAPSNQTRKPEEDKWKVYIKTKLHEGPTGEIVLAYETQTFLKAHKTQEFGMTVNEKTGDHVRMWSRYYHLGDVHFSKPTNSSLATFEISPDPDVTGDGVYEPTWIQLQNNCDNCMQDWEKAYNGGAWHLEYIWIETMFGTNTYFGQKGNRVHHFWWDKEIKNGAGVDIKRKWVGEVMETEGCECELPGVWCVTTETLTENTQANDICVYTQ